MRVTAILAALLVFVSFSYTPTHARQTAKPDPITTEAWREVVVSVHDLDEAARFFLDIAGYSIFWRGPESPEYLQHMGLAADATAQSLLLTAPGVDYGRVRLIKFENVASQIPTRPGARAWDSGCFFSIMMRAKGLDQIYADAIRMGWWTETPIADLTFGTSKLKIVIFRGPQGMQIQAYERLSPALPENFPGFERLSVPFNIMQIVQNRDASKHFYVDQLGFETFYLGKPYTSTTPTPTPLGIPVNLTTTARYRAGIYAPAAGEVGRVETIEMMDLKSADYADRCHAPNFGILSVKFAVPDARAANAELAHRGITQKAAITTASIVPYGKVDIFALKTPDGATLEFFSN